ncbi:UNVERIFIED_CONTAM: DUF350 domain-containing protein [Halobacillus marinus]|uniref:DUF350 domain-containing protein n=1 Tax=Bacillaceae TaxID=186817 RepID=UPI0002A4DA3A|nr:MULTISPECIES: DUF350 domain-containing protein [Bacillaceae]ELK47245.1 YshE protein [Halobacillus sp. BAB-2008]QHT47360.1 DUF350 domain-containing protein [Bacillus sp. SB49]
MDGFWEITLVETAARYSVVVLCLVVSMAVFEAVTSYNNWKEIKKGNMAVAMATGGKIFGVANIFRFSIQHNDSLLMTMGWGLYGFVLLLFGYFIFEFLTPSFKIDREIEEDNRAVGFISLVISVGLSYVIGANII